MITIDDALEQSWNYRKRTGRYARSVAMNVDTFRHLSRFQDGEGTHFVHPSGRDNHAYLFGIPIMVDSTVPDVRFQNSSVDEWECEYCGVIWPISIASVQCANCGGLRIW